MKIDFTKIVLILAAVGIVITGMVVDPKNAEDYVAIAIIAAVVTL